MSAPVDVGAYLKAVERAIPASSQFASRRAAAKEARAAYDELVKAATLAQRMNREALCKFNWGASALDANAIGLLNSAPAALDAALARVQVGP